MSLHLHYFRPAEFNRGGINWFQKTDAALLVRLDILRFRIGSPVIISPVDGATGRQDGTENKSQHNITYHGIVRAADFFVPGVSACRVVNAMRSLGFTGIGVYPDGLYGGKRETRYHGDVRTDRGPGNPAEWGHYDGKDCSINKALQRVAKL